MLYTHFTEEMLGLQDVKITNIERKDKKLFVYCELERKEHCCVSCGTMTDKIHDYRTQTVKDIPAFGNEVIIVLRKRRYCCPNCSKRFFETNPFVPKYNRKTNRLAAFVIDRLRDERSFTSVAREVSLSVSSVIRIFDNVSYPKAKLSKALSIDEFKGNTQGEKYQCILTDPENKAVLDILPNRYEHYLTTYFKQYPAKEREKVEYFVSDMWRTYSNISNVWFENAEFIVDKFHWIRQAIWAFERIRKEEQKKLGSELRKYFKRSRSLLIKKFDSLNDEQKQQVNVMLYYSVKINRAHWYKEQFLNIIACKDKATAHNKMIEWIENAECCDLVPFENCAKTMRNWYTGIINSFSTTLTNGFTEGCNNKIKVLKRNAYGYRNFNRFRNRILHIFSHQLVNKQQTAAC